MLYTKTLTIPSFTPNKTACGLPDVGSWMKVMLLTSFVFGTLRHITCWP
jgi:hypothetical protein